MAQTPLKLVRLTFLDEGDMSEQEVYIEAYPSDIVLLKRNIMHYLSQVTEME